MKKYSSLFLITIFISFCNFKYDNSECVTNFTREKLQNVKNKVMFIETKSSEEDIVQFGYGKIVFLDLDKGKKYCIGDNSYINESPIFSSTGNIVFLSARAGSKKELDVLGLSAQRQLYQYYPETHSYEKLVDFSKISNKDLVKTIKKVSLLDESNLVFSIKNKLVRFDFSNGELHDYAQIPNVDEILDFSINHKRKIIAFSYEEDMFSYNLALFIEGSKETKLIRNSDYEMIIGNWNTANNKFSFVDTTLQIFDLNNEKIRSLMKPKLNSQTISFVEFNFLNDSTGVFIGSKGNSTLPLRSEYDIYLYGLSKNEIIKKITSDNNLKSYLSSF